MEINSEEIQRNYQKIHEALKGTKRLIVLAHDNPDPDSISSAVTLAYIVKNKFKIPCSIKYGGIVGRAENRAMIRVLDFKVTPFVESDIKSNIDFALVDTQPKTGNNSFPKKRKPVIVIDHHPIRKNTEANFIDIRPDYGATATILSEYLLESGLEIPSRIATALSYGISSETQDLGREAGPVDIQAYLALFPHSNKKLLAEIEHPRLPKDYFITLNRALHHSFIYKNAVATLLGEVDNPDYIPFVADFMLRCERISWAICLGRYKDHIIVSVRTTNSKAKAGCFLKRLIGKKGVAGGHGMIAGGQITCSSMEHEHCTKIEEEFVQNFLKKLGYREPGEMTPILTSQVMS